jgi:hypothetical protein
VSRIGRSDVPWPLECADHQGGRHDTRTMHGRRRATSKVRRYGRGERASADTPSPSLVIPVVNVPSYVYGITKTA